MKSFKQRLAADNSTKASTASFKKLWTMNTLKGGHRANFELWKQRCLSEEEEMTMTLEEQLDLYKRFLIKIGLIDEA